MRRHFETHDFDHLQFDISIDLVVVEDAAGGQELAVAVEVFERFTQRAADRRDLLQYLRGGR